MFAAITGFGLTWIAQLIEGYATVIELVGGASMVWMGWRTFIAPPMAQVDDGAPDGGSNLLRAVVSTFFLTITNPVTLLSFGVMFAGLAAWRAGRAPSRMPAWWWPAWWWAPPPGGWS